MTLVEGVKKSFETKGMRLLLLLVTLGVVATFLRMFKGLGGMTNLTDDYPWGLWVAVDVFSGVALAAGGFAITAAVYIFNMKKYRPIARPAILTAFIGYSIVVIGLAIDIGKPFSAWHPIVMWNHRSVMFEVVWCITLYTTVLLFEFAPSFLERVKWDGALKVVKIIHYPLVIAGIVLSFLHQSSLGGFYLIAPAKLSHLWWTPNVPYMFYLSAIAAGLAMVTFEGIVSTRGLKREPETDIMIGLGRGTRIALLVYLVAKFADMTYRGNWQLLFAWDKASIFWSAEMLIGVILPILLLSVKSIKESENGLLTTSILVLFGVVFNRFNMTFFTQSTGVEGFYFPSIWEMFVTLGLLAAIVMLYRLAVMHLPVFHEGPLNR
jgi:Ni/Fe-hydrogenase subunit HybB-like protein